MLKLELSNSTELVLDNFYGRIDRLDNDEVMNYYMVCKLHKSFKNLDISSLIDHANKKGYDYIDGKDYFVFINRSGCKRDWNESENLTSGCCETISYSREIFKHEFFTGTV